MAGFSVFAINPRHQPFISPKRGHLWQFCDQWSFPPQAGRMEDEKEQPPTVPTAPRRVWGPLALEITSRCGAHAPVCSFVVVPELEPDVLSAVESEVLQDTRPAPNDTLDSFVKRLSRSKAFDNPRLAYPWRTRHGFFQYQAQLLPRQGGQARRATFSELTRPAFLDEKGTRVGYMRGYSHLYRHREDKRLCRPMPPRLTALRDALYSQVNARRAPATQRTANPALNGMPCSMDLSAFVVLQMRPFLSERSRLLGAPPSCEVLFYPVALNPATGRHRDGFTSADLYAYYAMGKDPFEEDKSSKGGQVKGTDVLIFTSGNAEMAMGLSFPTEKLCTLDRAEYIQPRELHIPLRPGTLLVYRPLDDLFFCHEVRFLTPPAPPALDGLLQSAGYRAAYVFRWLNESEERLYNLDTGRHVPTKEEVRTWRKPRKPMPL